MALSAWSVMIKLNSTSNMPKQLSALSKSLRATGRDVQTFEKQIDSLGAKIVAQNAPLGMYAAGLRNVGRAAKEASAAAGSVAASSFVASGAAATRAAQSVSRYAAAMAVVAGYSGGGGRGGGGSRVALGGGSPFYPPMRNVTPLALAGGRGGGIMPPGGGGGLGSYGGGRAGFAFPIGGGGGGTGGGGGAGGGGGYTGGVPLGGVGGFVADNARRAFKLGAEISAASLVDSVSSAATMQKALIGVQNATGASDAQILALRQKAFDLGDFAGMTGAKSAELLAVIARSSGGVFNDKRGNFDMRGFMAVAPTIAEIAKIQNLTRGVDINHAAQTEVQLMHLFRTYSGASFNQTGDLLTRLSEMMPDSLDVARNQFTYFLPLFKGMGITDKDSVATMALLDRMGYGRGKGGTNIADLLNASLGGLQLTSHAQAGKDALLKKIGVVDAKGNSTFFTDKGANLIGFLEQLNKFASTHGRIETMKDFKSAFGIQGSRIADLALDPQFVKQLASIEAVMNNPKISLFNQFGAYGRSADMQIGRGLANTQSVLTEIGWQLLPGVTLGFKALGDEMHSAQLWLHTHKQAEQEIMNGALKMAHAVGPALSFMGAEAVDAARGIRDVGRALATFTGWIGNLANVLSIGGLHKAQVQGGRYGAPARAWTANPFTHNVQLGPNGVPGIPGIGLQAFATGGRTKGEGVAYLHKNEVVVNDRVTRGVERMLSPGGGRGGATTIRLEIASNGTSQFDGMSQRDLKRLAREIANVLGNDVELDSRAGGNTPQLVGQSHYSVGQGRVT